MARFDNPASNQGAQGDFQGPVNITVHNHAPPPSKNTLAPRSRRKLLAALARRYRERLEDGLAYQVRLSLELRTRPDMIERPWMLHTGGASLSRSIPSGTTVLELFDEQEEQLLILGAAGAGKTMLLVELAQLLTERAISDDQARIPILLNIAAWRSGQKLRHWLPGALKAVLGGSMSAASKLAASDELLLLLDGLDEVAETHRTACVQAINDYLAEHDLPPSLVVGCRSHKYAGLDAKLQLAGAVEVMPLELPAVEQALAGVPEASGVLAALQTDALLRELATTPLIVNVLLLAHGGQEVPAVHAQTLDERRAALWHTYVRRMFQHRELARWPVRQALEYLRWLARQLCEQDKTDFLIDDLQPSMAPLGKPAQHYKWICCFAGCILGALLGSTFGWMAIASGHISLTFQRLVISPSSGAIVIGVVGILFFGLVGGLGGIIYDTVNDFIYKPIDRVEVLNWSRERLKRSYQIARTSSSVIRYIMFFIVAGLISGFILSGSVVGTISGVMISIVVALLFAVYIGGYRQESIPKYESPMQAINSSVKTRLVFVWPVSLFFGFIAFLLSILFKAGFLVGLINGSVVFTLLTVFYWQEERIQHYALRRVLSRAGLFPVRAVTFLNAMSEHLLLERDGAIYRFRHTLLRDHFASLTDTQLDELARDL